MREVERKEFSESKTLISPLPLPCTMSDLSVNIAGLRMKNPLMLASGIMDETGESMLMAIKKGAGAVVTKSVGLEANEGHRNPTAFEIGDGLGLLNAMGLPNPGIVDYEREVKIALTGGVPVIGSIFGANENDFSYLAGRMEDYGASAVELNLSCPHARGLGMDIGADPKEVKRIVSAVSSSVSVPVFAKLTPNVPDIASIAISAVSAGAKGVVAINTVKGMLISPEVRRPVLGNGVGGLSGPAILPVGIRSVFEIRERFDMENIDAVIIGVGGISTASDALQYIMAGADAVQIGSAIRWKGPAVFRAVSDGIKAFMEREGFSRIEDMKGIAQGVRE